MQTIELARSYKAALDEAEAANRRYMALFSQQIIREPIADTVEERQAQYQKLRAEQKKRQPAIVAAGEALNDACLARDAAFAALKGN
jgi:hypothetical protein